MMRNIPNLLAAATLLVVAGCSTPETRIEDNPGLYQALPESERASVQKGALREGMTPDAVFLAWGKPDRVRTGVDEGTPFETWIYLGYRSEMVPVFPWGGLGPCRGYYRSGFDYDFVTVPYVHRTATFRKGRLTSWEVPNR